MVDHALKQVSHKAVDICTYIFVKHTTHSFKKMMNILTLKNLKIINIPPEHNEWPTLKKGGCVWRKDECNHGHLMRTCETTTRWTNMLWDSASIFFQIKFPTNLYGFLAQYNVERILNILISVIHTRDLTRLEGKECIASQKAILSELYQ